MLQYTSEEKKNQIKIQDLNKMYLLRYGYMNFRLGF
jgi:hypothetical protein